jgi:UDP-glucose 4-epimerase
MKVFLTGGTGFIGQPLTKTLLMRGWSVTALVRKPNSPQAQGLGKIGAQLSTGDVTERESMRTAMNGAEIVVHNARHYEYGVDQAGKQRMHAINVTGTDNVLGLAHEIGIPRIVYVSTVQAFGETGPQPRDETFKRRAPCRTTYEQSKTDAHEIALQHAGEFGISVLRKYWGIGVASSLIDSLLEWSIDGNIIRKINLRVRADNHRAISLYKLKGFVVEGILKNEIFLNNTYYDNLWMGLEI